MPKEKPNGLQRFVRGLIREAIASTHKPKPRKTSSQSIPSHTTETNTIQAKRTRDITLKVRMQILQRDSFQCVYCGRKPPDVKLEIDHIIPFSKGGSNDISNLQTLCFDCNRGKSNHL
jgi:5-methylcytosine-specific restriction enzyme A